MGAKHSAVRAIGRRVVAAVAAVPLFAIAFSLILPPVSAEAGAENPWTQCAKATNQVEREAGIPRQLLRAISKIEAGRFYSKKQVTMAWPWTVMAQGRGRYLPTKQAAIAEVEALRAAGVRNIDVGCMQVNLKYHPEAFPNLEAAFDPLTNVRYAATYLTALQTEHGSWAKAVARYHSATPGRYRDYRQKVHKVWQQEREKYLAALDDALSRTTTIQTFLDRLDGAWPGQAVAPRPEGFRAVAFMKSSPAEVLQPIRRRDDHRNFPGVAVSIALSAPVPWAFDGPWPGQASLPRAPVVLAFLQSPPVEATTTADATRQFPPFIAPNIAETIGGGAPLPATAAFDDPA